MNRNRPQHRTSIKNIAFDTSASAETARLRCMQFSAASLTPLQTSINIADQEALDLTMPLARSEASA
jgi:hypothetical protein